MPSLHAKSGIIEQRFQLAFAKAVDEHFRDVSIRRQPVAKFALAAGNVDQVFCKPAPTAGMAKLLPKIVCVQHERTSVFDRSPRVIQKLSPMVAAGNHSQRTK